MIFLNLTPKVKATKEKIKKWGCIKLKSFCSARKIINKMTQSMESGRKFTNRISNKGLIYKT